MKLTFSIYLKSDFVEIEPGDLLIDAVRKALEKIKGHNLLLQECVCVFDSDNLVLDLKQPVNNQLCPATQIPLELDTRTIYIIHQSQVVRLITPGNPYRSSNVCY